MTPFGPGVTGADTTSRVITDPGLSQADKTGLRSLELIDISEGSLEQDITRSLVPEPKEDITNLDPPTKTLTRQDSTSTQTYAPDNYDRTLQRSDARDGANVYTGTKSESGDNLTAQYAKNIFHSKSSSQRMDNFKIYSGLVAGILLMFIILAAYRWELDAENIESSLRPLKHDPMPGMIKNTAEPGFTNIFANSSAAEVDSRALELVASEEAMVGEQQVVVNPVTIETSETAEISQPSQEQSSSAASDEAQQLAAVSTESAVENIISNLANGQSGDNSSRTLQITSKSTITEKDRLLQEAYSAYQQGKDQLALAKYNQVLGLDPGSRNALLARAAINIQNNNMDAAIRDYQTLLVANPKDSLAMSSMTAVANYSPQQSESLLKLLIRDEPDSPYLNFALGNVYVAQNRWPEAQGQYFTAFQNNSNDPNYAYNLAVSLEHINQPKVAILYYQRALDNFSNGLATFNRDVVDQRLEMLGQL